MTARPADLELELNETRQSLLLISKALEFSTEAIGMSDLQGHHFYHNPAFTELFEYTAEELSAAGESAAVYVDKSIHKRVFDAILNGKQWVGETRMVSKTGRRFPVSLRAHAVKDQEDKIIGLIGYHRDITEHEKARKTHQIQQVHFQQLFENSLDAIVMVNEKDQILGVNRAFEALFQFSLEEVRGMRLDDIIVPYHVMDTATELTNRSLKGETMRIETVRRCKDHRLVQVEVVGFPVLLDTSVVGAYVIYRDISQRKKAEAALQKAHDELEIRVENRTAELTKINAALRNSEKKYRLLAENISDVIWTMDLNGRFTYVSPSVAKMRGYSAEEAMAQPLEQIVAPASLEMAMTMLSGALDGDRVAGQPDRDRTYRLELELNCKDGSTVWTELRAALLLNSADEKIGIIGSSRDISERKQAEKQVRTLTRELIEAQENERQRISRELHDRIAQDLSSSKIACDLLLNSDPLPFSKIIPRIAEFSRILNTTILSVRDLAYDLRPPGLDELGLAETIFLFCEEFSEKTGVAVAFHYAGIDSLCLRLDAEINIFRLIQEGLNNIWKHAGARNGVVRLVGAAPNIILRIEDDGTGFDVEKRLDAAIDEKRMGLRSMEERVHLLRGRMTIQSRAEEGTIIIIKFPYEENECGSD